MKHITWGILLWLVATILFRLLGQYFLDPDRQWVILLTFILTIPLIFGITVPYFKVLNIPSSDLLKAAVLIALPGMLLDIISLIKFNSIFVNLNEESFPYFAAWLLWAYGLILSSGFISTRTQKV